MSRAEPNLVGHPAWQPLFMMVFVSVMSYCNKPCEWTVLLQRERTIVGQWVRVEVDVFTPLRLDLADQNPPDYDAPLTQIIRIVHTTAK